MQARFVAEVFLHFVSTSTPPSVYARVSFCRFRIYCGFVLLFFFFSLSLSLFRQTRTNMRADSQADMEMQLWNRGCSS